MILMADPFAGDAVDRRRALRQAAIVARGLQKKSQVATWSRRVRSHLKARWPMPPGRVVAFCWPLAGEPDLRPLIADWVRDYPQTVFALPVVIDRAQPLAFRPWQAGAAMVTDRFGIPAPAAGDFVRPDVLLIPLNTFDAAGYRIGYGGGFFDRTLAALSPPPLAIGIGFELGRVADTLPQAHDVPMDWLVTEAGVFAPQVVRCSNSAVDR